MHRCNIFSHRATWLNWVIGLWVILLSSAVWAEGTELKLPLPKAKGNYSETQQCVEPIDMIRRLHGSLLKQQRNTLEKTKFSLLKNFPKNLKVGNNTVIFFFLHTRIKNTQKFLRNDLSNSWIMTTYTNNKFFNCKFTILQTAKK